VIRKTHTRSPGVPLQPLEQLSVSFSLLFILKQSIIVILMF
jgi:hypothetical protein